jgi:membrane-associated phospholipid phosphatase
VLLLALTFVLLTLWSVYGAGQWHGLRGYSIRLTFFAMVGNVNMSFLVRGRQLWNRDPVARKIAIRDAWFSVNQFMPVVLAILAYENLHDLTNLIHPLTVDDALLSADRWLFGVEPTQWLDQHFIVPLFTDWMVFTYGLYFVLPVSLALVLYSNRNEAAFRSLMLSTLICLCCGFIGYLLVPAVGPRYWLKDSYSVPVLRGWLFTGNASATFKSVEAVMRDCFPSLHTAVSSVSLYWAFRLRHVLPGRSLWFWVYLPLVVSLWFSTVYLRQHWVVDVFAGWAVAALAVWLAARVTSRYIAARDRVLAAAGETSAWTARTLASQRATVSRD